MYNILIINLSENEIVIFALIKFYLLYTNLKESIYNFQINLLGNQKYTIKRI